MGKHIYWWTYGCSNDRSSGTSWTFDPIFREKLQNGTRTYATDCTTIIWKCFLLIYGNIPFLKLGIFLSDFWEKHLTKYNLSCPTGSSSLRWVLTSFVLPVHNQGASLAIYQDQALWRKFLPATSSFFVLSLLIQTLLLQHLSVDASCNHYGCFILWIYAAFRCVPGRLISPSIFDAS